MPKNPATLSPKGNMSSEPSKQRPEITQVNKGAEAKGKLVDAAKADLYPTFFAATIASVARAPGRQ